ncbi:hypothetical protein ACFY04_43060 [Streptomyces sp. NPDC001549]|uniref:hypothetical protein n=1 Tax=Streptomyces sp. NPDC001549 TaxID=3364586 RepID=UPI0036A6075D
MLRAFFHPVDIPYRRDDEEFVKRFDIGYLAMWQAHPHGAGTGHPGHGHSHPGTDTHDHSHPGHGTEPHDHTTVVTARFDVTTVLAATAEAEEHLLTLQYMASPHAAG